jgi:hypothetical protein
VSSLRKWLRCRVCVFLSLESRPGDGVRCAWSGCAPGPRFFPSVLLARILQEKELKIKEVGQCCLCGGVCQLCGLHRRWSPMLNSSLQGHHSSLSLPPPPLPHTTPFPTTPPFAFLVHP